MLMPTHMYNENPSVIQRKVETVTHLQRSDTAKIADDYTA